MAISYASFNKSSTLIVLSSIIYIAITLVLNWKLGRLVEIGENQKEEKYFSLIAFLGGSTVFFILLSLPTKFDYNGVKGLSAVIFGSIIVGCFLGITVGSNFIKK